MKYNFDDYTTAELSLSIEACIKDKRARAILKDRFIDGMTFCELSAKYHLSELQVKRIVYKHGDYLLSKLM